MYDSYDTVRIRILCPISLLGSPCERESKPGSSEDCGGQL